MSTLNELLPLDSTPSAAGYLEELSSLSLEKLLAEPASLQTRSHHLTSSLTTLTHSSYPSLISIHESSASLDVALESLSQSLDSLVDDSLPALQSAAAAWPKHTDAVLRERTNIRSVLDLHDKIRDLLDIPLLIHTCVRNGFFAEALSLSAHANALANEPNPPPILASILADVRTSMNHMLLTLLSTLHEPKRKVPALWKAVNFLRKMVPDDDTEQLLALIFLSGRDSCLVATLHSCARDVTSLIANLEAGTDIELTDRDRDDLARYLKKHADVWREGVYDVITQYTTIFLDGKSNHAFTHTLLSTYTSYALSTHLFPIVTTLLPHLHANLSSFLTQLTYCANAFARVGLDFRSLLPRIFCDAVLDATHSQLAVVVAAFERKLETAFSTKSRTPAKQKSPIAWLVNQDAAGAIYDPTAPVHVPPHSLTLYPSLADLQNGFLNVLNTLRQLAPVAITNPLAEMLDKALARCGEALATHLRSISTEDSKDLLVIKRIGDAYFRVVVPYTRRALTEGVYRRTEEVKSAEELQRAIAQWEAWLDIPGDVGSS